MAERPSLPDGLEQALKNIREGFNLRWNPQAVLNKVESVIYYDKVKEAAYEPRWELWDTDANNNDYKVMTIRTPAGGFRQPGFWLVELLNFLNPARYGGNLSKMLSDVLDQPNNLIAEVAENDLDDLIDQASKWHWYAATPKITTSGLYLPFGG